MTDSGHFGTQPLRPLWSVPLIQVAELQPGRATRPLPAFRSFTKCRKYSSLWMAEPGARGEEQAGARSTWRAGSLSLLPSARAVAVQSGGTVRPLL